MNAFMEGHRSAREICEQQISETARALLTQTFEDFEIWFDVPLTFETFDIDHTIESRLQLRESFFRVCSHYERLGVTQIERQCVAAEFIDGHSMNATHENRILRRNELLIEPFPTYSVSHLIDGHWRIVKLSYAVIDEPELVRAIVGNK